MKNWLQKANCFSRFVTICFFFVQSNAGAQHFIFEYSGPDSIFVDENCIAVLEWGDTTVTVEPVDPQNGQTIIYFEVENISGGFSEGDTIPPAVQVAVTYRAIDNLGNDSLFTFTIDFVDPIPPVISGVGADITVDCDEIPASDPAVASDNCDPAPDLVFNESVTQGSCAHEFTLTWTWTATDMFGNSTVKSRTITVVDNSNPSFILPPDITVSCQNAGNLAITGVPLALMDNCDNNLVIYYSDITTGGYCPQTYTISRTWEVEDNCANSASGVQTITVQDITPPVFVNPAADENYACDTDLNADAAFADWLAALANASAADNCSATPALRWFAAVPGSYDLSDTLTFPGIFPTELDTAICPAPVMGIYRSTMVDFVVYDLCGNASVSTAAFNVVDNTAPVFENCVNDTTISSEAGLCEAVFELPPPVISDECANNFNSEQFNTSAAITSPMPGDANVVVSPVSLVFSNIPVSPVIASGPVTLTLDLINVDAEAISEYFIISGEDGSVLGQTANAPSQCEDATTTVDIPASSFNDWTADGDLVITLIPNEPGQPNLAINDICGGSSVDATLDYVSQSPDLIDFFYSINGSTPIPAVPGTIISETLPVGINEVTYFANDCAGNTGTCVFTVTVQDVEAPEIVCPADISATLAPEDDCSQGLEILLPFPLSIDDNCNFPVNSMTQPLNPAEALLSFSYEPNYLDYIADDKTIVFPNAMANAAGSDVILTVTIQGDVADPEAYFTIFSEDNMNLGTTEAGQPNVVVDTAACPDLTISTTTINIPTSLYNNWAADGTVTFTAISNKTFADPPPGGNGDGINPACMTFPPGTPDGTTDDQSNMIMELAYNFATPFYYAEGATEIPVTELPPPNTSPSANFNAGTTTVYYFVEDGSGNADTCSFQVFIEDATPPQALCQVATIFVNPSGLETYTLDPSEVDNTSTDNCEIAFMTVSPDVFNCNEQGTLVPVTLTVTDIFGNTANCVTQINVQTQPPLPTYSIGICGNDTLSLFANPPPAIGNNIYSYVWNGPNSFTSVDENPQIPNADHTYSGSYSVTVTGFTGCTAVGTVEVSINASPDVPNINVNGNEICSDDELVLSTQTYSGSVVNYYWYEGVSPTGTLITTTPAPTLTMSPPLSTGATSYYVIVEVDGCFSQASDFETVNVTPTPVATVNDAVIDVCEGELIILGTSETDPGYAYSWTGPNGFTSGLQYPQTFNATLPDDGTYTLVITDNNCASTPVTTEVNVTATPATPTISSVGSVCEGGSLTLTASTMNGDFYTWTAPDFSIQITSTNSLFLSGVTPDFTGNWTVVVTKNGCSSDMSAPFPVVVEPGLSINASNDSPVCNSEQVQLSVNTIPGAAYNWSGPSGFTSVLQNPIAPAVAGTYSVTVTSLLGCSNSAMTEVLVNTPPVITALSNNGAPCVTGANDILLIATVFPPDNGSYQYSWTGPNGFSSSNAIPVLPGATSADNGSYSLIVTDGNGCTSAPATTVVNVSDVPPTPAINGTSQLCESENLSLTTQSYSGTNVLYTWLTPLGSIPTMSPTLTIISATTMNSGDYQVMVSVDGCVSSLSGVFSVEVNAIPAIPVATSNVPVCAGATIELYTPFVPGASYLWTGPSGVLSSLQNPVIPDASAANEGAYSVQVSINGCESGFSAPVNVVIYPTPPPPVVTNSGSVCIDSPFPSLILSIDPSSAVPGAAYTWFNAQQGAQIAGPTLALNATINDFSNYTEGVYDFYVIAELGGCPGVSSIPTTVFINEIPNIQASAGNDAQLCNNTQVTLNANTPAIGTGQWTQLSGPTATIADPGLATSLVSNLSGGNVYVFEWSLSNGACQNYDADEVTIIVDEDTQIAEAGLNLEVCNDTTAILNANPPNPGASGMWTQSPGQAAMGVVIVDASDANSLVTGLEADQEYVFTWTLSNTGCGEFSADDVVVFVIENFETAIAGNDMAVCGNGSAQLNAETPGSGIGTWSTVEPGITFSDANDPQTEIFGLQNGIYLFTWTLDNGVCGTTTDNVELEYEIEPQAFDDEFSVNYSSSANFNVLNNDFIQAPVEVQISMAPVNGTAEHLGNGVFSFTANSSFTGTDEFTYRVCSQLCEDVCSEATVSLRIGDDVECVAPTIFTPNNDGINDAFIIPCLATGNYPDNSVSIFNQWGDQVFHASPYMNDWQGTYNGQDLPVGTYYFVVKYHRDQPHVAGFLVLER